MVRRNDYGRPALPAPIGLYRYRHNAATKDVLRFVRDLAARDDNGTYVPFFLQRWEDAVTVSLQKRSGP